MSDEKKKKLSLTVKTLDSKANPCDRESADTICCTEPSRDEYCRQDGLAAGKVAAIAFF